MMEDDIKYGKFRTFIFVIIFLFISWGIISFITMDINWAWDTYTGKIVAIIIILSTINSAIEL